MLKPNILRKKSDFSSIYNKGKSVGDRYVVIFYKKNGLGEKRVAFLASKKVGNAIKRNRARRLMKESYRQISSGLENGYDYIFIARNTILNKKCADVKKSMESAVKKAGLQRKMGGLK